MCESVSDALHCVLYVGSASVRCSGEVHAALRGFMTEKGGRVGYDLAWKQWRAFLRGCQLPGCPGELLTGLTDDQAACWIGLFARYLYLKEKKRGWAVDKTISALRMVMTEHSRATPFFESTLVQKVKRCCRPDAAEQRVAHDNLIMRQGLPMSLDMVWAIRGEFWDDSSWFCEGMDRRMIWLGVGMGFDNGPRVCHLTKAQGQHPRNGAIRSTTPKPPDHCIKAGHVRFHVLILGTEHIFPGGRMFREGVGLLDDFPACVTECKYTFVSGKNKFVKAEQTLGRRSPEEGTLLDDLAWWCLRSGVEYSEDLFTRHRPEDDPNRKCSVKSLTRDMFVGGIRWSAAHFGLPPNAFFSKASRKGTATALKVGGRGPGEIRHGRWSQRSFTPDRVYIARLEADGRDEEEKEEEEEELSSRGGALSIGVDPKFTVKHVGRLAAQGNFR